jgi:hypothetical protein
MGNCNNEKEKEMNSKAKYKTIFRLSSIDNDLYTKAGVSSIWGKKKESRVFE